mgnify:CR=1 FL=1
MSRIYDDNSLAIGNTPLVKLNHVTKNCKATVLAKVEGRNPAYSVKCRIGANMIWDAEKSGKLTKDKVIVEPTSGNTGIALAFTAAARGYKLILTMPESMSIERRRVMAVMGAEIVLTEAAKGMPGAIAKAKEIADSNPSKFFMPGQFDNPANPAVHERTTAEEIWRDCAGQLDALVAGVGTGGTITGCARLLKQRNPDLQVVAVEPAGSAVLSGKPPGAHRIQGIGAGFVPAVLDRDLIDEVIAVDDADAMETGRRLARSEGLLCGISSGAAVAAALQLAQRPSFTNRRIVVMLASYGERYLSTPMFTSGALLPARGDAQL